MHRYTSNLLTSSLSLVLVAAGAVMAGQAQAVTVTRDYLIQPTANCQGALPNYEGNLRKRPLAVQNQGVTSAYVSCGFQDINNGGTGYSMVSSFFINNSSGSVTVNCTLVNGIWNPSFFPVSFFPKSVTISAGGIDLITWDATADNGGTNFVAPALSCNLPGGSEISIIQGVYPEDVGA